MKDKRKIGGKHHSKKGSTVADISKCEGQIFGGTIKTFVCPLRDKCYRFTASASHLWQSWIEVPYDQEKKECEMFMDNESKKETSKP